MTTLRFHAALPRPSTTPAAGRAAASVSTLPPLVREALQGASQPLDARTRARFGHAFAETRVDAPDQAPGPRISHPSEPREREADRVAGEVARRAGEVDDGDRQHAA